MVSGTESGALVEYSANGSTWSTTPPALSQGSNTVHVRQTDVAGNVSAANLYFWIRKSRQVATTIPVVVIV